MENVRNCIFVSALHYCCGQLDLVAAASVTVAAPELLESADEDGFTPLHLAVIQGNMPLVNLLLANKANVDALDNEGHSVIHWATGNVMVPLGILLHLYNYYIQYCFIATQLKATLIIRYFVHYCSFFFLQCSMRRGRGA